MDKKRIEPWINSRMYAFRIHGDDKVLMRNSAIRNVNYQNDCDAHVTMECYLPYALDEIFDFEHDDSVHIREIMCGDISDPENGRIVIALDNIRDIYKTLTDVVIFNSDNESVIVATVDFKCQIIIFEE